MLLVHLESIAFCFLNQSISTIFNYMTWILYNTQFINTCICICENRTINVTLILQGTHQGVASSYRSQVNTAVSFNILSLISLYKN